MAKRKAAKRQELRAELLRALRTAVDGEVRFGPKGEMVRPELDARWSRVLDLLEQLLG